MLLSSFLCFGFLAAGCLGVTRQDGNYYMDKVLFKYLPNNIRSGGLDPTILPDFKVKVEGTIFKGTRDFKAKFKSGQLHGLASVPSRHGDCTGPKWQGRNIILGCWVALEGLRAHYNVTSKGDSLISIEKKYTGDFTVRNTNVFVEISQERGGHPVVQTFQVGRMTLDWNLSDKIQLNYKRMRKYEERSKYSVQRDVDAVLNGAFRNALQRSVQIKPLPPP